MRRRAFEDHPAQQRSENRGQQAYPPQVPGRLSLGQGRSTVSTQEAAKDPQKRAITAGTAVQSNNGDLLYELARNGMGTVVLPEFHVADGLISGDVIRVLDD